MHPFAYTFCATLLCLLLCTTSTNTRAGQALVAAVDQDIINDYLLFVGERDPLRIDHYAGPGARRDVIELLLLQQALHLGGLSEKLILRPENSYLRIIKLLRDGQVAISGAPKWLEDIDPYREHLLISPAVVADGEFIVGLYTRPNHQRALGAQTRAAISQLSAASNNHWQADVRTLKALGIQKIYYTTYWEQIVRMVLAGRADFTLAPFQSNPDMKVQLENLELVPIPGIKVALSGSRHWAISKHHPLGERIFNALQKGIQQLHTQGTIQRAYEECGFFHPAVRDWELLNPPITTPTQHNQHSFHSESAP